MQICARGLNAARVAQRRQALFVARVPLGFWGVGPLRTATIEEWVRGVWWIRHEACGCNICRGFEFGMDVSFGLGECESLGLGVRALTWGALARRVSCDGRRSVGRQFSSFLGSVVGCGNNLFRDELSIIIW